MSFFYGDIKSDELKTANGLELQGGANNAYTITLDTRSNIATNYQLNLPSTLGSAEQYIKILDVSGSTANLGFSTVVSASSALDDITAGDAASTLTTTTGNITIDAQSGNINIVSGSGAKIINTIDTIDVLELYSSGANLNGSIITSNTFSITQGPITVSATGTEVLDFSDRSDFLITLSSNSTLTLACTNVNRQGQQGSIIITQTSGTNALSWQTSNGWYFASATAPTLSSGSGIYDVFSYLVVDTGVSKKVLVMDATNFQAY